MQNIVDFIKKEMSARGMTYDQLAQYMGATRQNMWIKLNVVHCPNFETVKKMLAALEIEPDVQRKGGSGPEGLDKEALFGCLEEEQVSYEVFERILDALGYEVVLKNSSTK